MGTTETAGGEDREIEAMKMVVAAMEGLGTDESMRVLRWVDERFGYGALTVVMGTMRKTMTSLTEQMGVSFDALHRAADTMKLTDAQVAKVLLEVYQDAATKIGADGD